MAGLAVVTMVRDDAFFLDIWLRHYGGMVGRENLYIVNHGRGEGVARQAAGCNIIGIPGDPHPNFDMKRWRLLNNLVGGLRGYYDWVIVGDVDELVVVDPAAGQNLTDFLAAQPMRRVLTPLGLEVIHRIDLEPDAIGDRVLGPRRHVRPAPLPIVGAAAHWGAVMSGPVVVTAVAEVAIATAPLGKGVTSASIKSRGAGAVSSSTRSSSVP